VAYYTDQLSGLERDGVMTGWEEDADYLMEARHQFNAMDASLYKLRAIGPQASPWQQQAIDRIAPKAYEMATYLNDLIKEVNNYQGDVHLHQRYAQDTDRIFNRADYIVNSVDAFEQYASARQEIQQLRPELGLKAGS